jgi:hypothetical protein
MMRLLTNARTVNYAHVSCGMRVRTASVASLALAYGDAGWSVTAQLVPSPITRGASLSTRNGAMRARTIQQITAAAPSTRHRRRIASRRATHLVTATGDVSSKSRYRCNSRLLATPQLAFDVERTDAASPLSPTPSGGASRVEESR